MAKEISVMMFGRDLRIRDNPALKAASESGGLFPVYFFEDYDPKYFKPKASDFWLKESLSLLNESLEGKLNFYFGRATEIFKPLIKKYRIKGVFWNSPREPGELISYEKLKKFLDEKEIKYATFDGSGLWDYSNSLKEDGTFYKVFSAYKRKASSLRPRGSVEFTGKFFPAKDPENEYSLENFIPEPRASRGGEIKKLWKIGESEAQKKLIYFIENNLKGYREGRNYPEAGSTSKLSPHLAFGEISVSSVWGAVSSLGSLYAGYEDIESFLSEITWREFAGYVNFFFPKLGFENFDKKFDFFPWKKNEKLLAAWKKGLTGYPFVDAGMRELYSSGYMHNRLRMVTASFLTKNLKVDWREGRSWFEENLIDLDSPNNSFSWQWVAGSGLDAAPYFRIFNPVTQGEKFDPEGGYIKKFIPELSGLPKKYLHRPWEASEETLKEAGVVLGENYPKTVIDLDESRKAALAAYKGLKNL